ncbi:hypothetical protein QCA50_002006 [Cerrena zonata]|uniref:Xylanolytic transcriptional activator regulatory domain-containing protein n=1 Tax=Cerrena zonata TaxID=2478898 RepID=A0AAW0GW53_9APHY
MSEKKNEMVSDTNLLQWQLLIKPILRSDARRPCSGCIRSHAYALAHAPLGTDVPEEPDCTFDEGAEIPDDVETPEDRARAAALEDKIAELETLLKLTEWQANMIPDKVSNDDFFWPAGSQGNTPDSLPSTSETEGSRSTFSAECTTQDLWPPNLPPLNILHHLADACFKCIPQSRRLVHSPSFIASFSLSPSDPNFPPLSLLHAICAAGGRYMAKSLTSSYITGEQKDYYGHKSFVEEQATLARQSIQMNTQHGDKLLQHLQACVLLTWYYWYSAKWMDVHILSGMTLRTAVSMGLNMSPPYPLIVSHPDKTTKITSLLPPARDRIELEIRRNVFWSAYCIERLYGCGNGWPLSLSDEDISQVMPTSLHDFEAGVITSPEDRQWSHDKDILTKHPNNHSDPFILYVKSVILLSRVKSLCLRARIRYYPQIQAPDIAQDPRLSAEFWDLETAVNTFKNSLPTLSKSPITGEVVDPLLFSVVCAPYVAKIFLHEQFAHVGNPSCISAFHTLTNARSIIDLLHAVTMTEFDLSRIGLFPIFAWFTAGRVITRFLRAAQTEGSSEHREPLEHEAAFVLGSLKALGDSIPLSRRYAGMLDDHLHHMCGMETAAKVHDLSEKRQLERTSPEELESIHAEAVYESRLEQGLRGYLSV